MKNFTGWEHCVYGHDITVHLLPTGWCDGKFLNLNDAGDLMVRTDTEVVTVPGAKIHSVEPMQEFVKRQKRT